MSTTRTPPDMQLSEHFWLSEFISSQAATRLGLNNTPTDEVVQNLRRVAQMLELVRQRCGGRPVVISSGYRSPDVNRAVKGAANSAHVVGLAADITVPGLTPFEVCKLLVQAVANCAELCFDQLIYEGTWVHLGLSDSCQPPRVQVLTAVFSPSASVRYVKGLQEAGRA